MNDTNARHLRMMLNVLDRFLVREQSLDRASGDLMALFNELDVPIEIIREFEPYVLDLDVVVAIAHDPDHPRWSLQRRREGAFSTALELRDRVRAAMEKMGIPESDNDPERS